MNLDENGNFYFGDLRPGCRPATEAEIAIHQGRQAVEEKQAILIAAQASREIALSRLSRIRVIFKEAGDTAAVAAIDAADAAFVNMFLDPRIIASVNGAAKGAIATVYQEIVVALLAAAPAVVLEFKKLDKLQ